MKHLIFNLTKICLAVFLITSTVSCGTDDENINIINNLKDRNNGNGNDGGGTTDPEPEKPSQISFLVGEYTGDAVITLEGDVNEKNTLKITAEGNDTAIVSLTSGTGAALGTRKGKITTFTDELIEIKSDEITLSFNRKTGDVIVNAPMVSGKIGSYTFDGTKA